MRLVTEDLEPWQACSSNLSLSQLPKEHTPCGQPKTVPLGHELLTLLTLPPEPIAKYPFTPGWSGAMSYGGFAQFLYAIGEPTNLGTSLKPHLEHHSQKGTRTTVKPTFKLLYLETYWSFVPKQGICFVHLSSQHLSSFLTKPTRAIFPDREFVSYICQANI